MTTEDLAAVLAALPLPVRCELLGQNLTEFQAPYRELVEQAESRASKLESELSAEREANAILAQKFEDLRAMLDPIGEWCKRVDALASKLKNTYREASPPSPPPADVCGTCGGDRWLYTRRGDRQYSPQYPYDAAPCPDCTGRPPPEETAGKDGRE